MRIKEEIKKAGVFWLPTYPQNQIPGTISISDRGNVKLEIAQSLDPSMQAQLGGTPPDSLNEPDTSTSKTRFNFAAKALVLHLENLIRSYLRYSASFSSGNPSSSHTDFWTRIPALPLSKSRMIPGDASSKS